MWIGGVRVLILDQEDQVLLIRQRHEDRDIWMLPGGGIEAGENSEQAAIREMKEETGLDISVKELLWHVEEVSEKRGQRFVNFFLAGIEGGVLSLGTDPERGVGGQVMRELRFFSREEIESLEALYPAYLRDELWLILESGSDRRNRFRLRNG